MSTGFTAFVFGLVILTFMVVYLSKHMDADGQVNFYANLSLDKLFFLRSLILSSFFFIVSGVFLLAF